MRNILLLLSFFFGIGAHAQQINGFAKDGDGKAVKGATVSLLRDTGKAVLKFTVSKNNGEYSFADVTSGNYRVSVSHVGYQPSMSPVFSVGTTPVTVTDFKLAKASGNLANVTVTASKPIVEIKADKTVLNVENTINAVGSDALELLRKSPGVTVDKDDNLAMSGKSGVQVYIDGRPTPLSGTDLSTYLKTLQSSSIESIELITNPSAKYEAAGNAGIINIRLKKNKSLGFNGSANAGFNIGTYAKYNGGVNLNYRNRTMNVFGNYSFNKATNWSEMKIHRQNGDTLFDQQINVKNENLAHNFKAGIDFFLTKQSTLGVMVNGTFSSPEIHSNNRTPISYIPTNTVDRILVANNTSDMKRNNTNANLNYTYNGKDGKSLTLNADYGMYDFDNNQYQPNRYYDPTGTFITDSAIYRMLSPSEVKISSFKADYEQNFLKGKLGFGGKLSYVKTDNDFQRYDVYSTGEVLDKDHSNRFKYTENINAVYANYNRVLKGKIIQIGLRVENTVSEGNSTGENSGVKFDSTFKRNYVDFFPSAAITFNKNPMKQWSITYSRRIDRPAYQDLNPFEFKLDEYTYQKGNVNLRPQYTHSIGVTNTYKYKLNTTLNYSHVDDLFVQWIDTIETSKSFITKKNLATQDIINLNVSYPFIYKTLTVFGNMNANYSMYEADFGPGREVDQEAFGLNIFVQNSLKFGKTKLWTAELTGFYNAPTIYMGAFKGKGMGSVDAGIQRQVMQGRGTIKTSVSDVFNTLKFRASNDFAGQKTDFSAKWESRQFKLNFVYRFGRNQIKGARNRSGGAEDETKRANQQGGGGIGIGGQ